MKKGVSLIEVLIAISLFAIVAITSSTILIDIVQLEKKSSVENAIYEDLRIMLQLLTNEIQSGTVDYDEYYNFCVIQDGLDTAYFGINHGVYGSRFFDPGKSLDPIDDAIRNPQDLGLECSYMPGNECQVVYTLATDLNTGQNPFYGDASSANAFGDIDGPGGCADVGITYNATDHLFLIDNTGTQKTIIAKKKININDYAIGLVRMKGIDFDQNGLVDSFTCLDEFDCDEGFNPNVIKIPYLDLIGKDINQLDPQIRLPQESDLTNLFDADNTQFVPISPMRANIQELKFIIQPLEDPYKAFAEPDFRAHPTVTIIMTVGLSENAELDYPGEFEPITVQTTVAAGVIGRIETYPPVNEIMNDPGVSTSWIYDVGIPNTPIP